MSNPLRFPLALVLLLLAGGCTVFEARSNVAALHETQPQGGDFAQAVTHEYRDFATFEMVRMWDWQDANRFARKGLQTAAGTTVPPEELAAWNLPEDKVAELTEARARLIEVFDAGAREERPELAAGAQGAFDCWVEQQEENYQPEDIAACRDAFYRTLEGLETWARIAAIEPAAGPRPMTYTVLFGFDSTKISPAARQTINRAAQAIARNDPVIEAVVVEGHADRAGPAEYNLRLSRDRAEAVRRALTGHGVPSKLIGIRAEGESDPAVTTPDDVAEPRNRRVRIHIAPRTI